MISSDALAKRKREQDIRELAGATIVPGAFYICRQVGGWQDVKSGIRFSGPKAIIDPDSREIVELVELPQPVQIPHVRLAEYSALPDHEKRRVHRDDSRARGERELFEVEFSCLTTDNFCDGLTLAIRTGNITQVSDYDMETLFSETWAKRETKLVHGRTVEERVQQPEIAQLFDDLMQSRRVSLAQESATRTKK